MNVDGYEIERRFLIAYPDKAVLEKCENVSAIVQTYLKREGEHGRERVRMRSFPDRVEYTHTEKKWVSDIRREENERKIDETEYNALLQYADPSRKTVEKSRYCLRYRDQLFEIDIYPFWNDRALMEIELENEKQKVVFPENIVIVKEVTEDGRYTNSSLALSVPLEELARGETF